MKKDINKLIEESFELAKKHEQIVKEILGTDDSLSTKMREEFGKINERFEQQRLDQEKYLEDNKHRKIIGYNPDDFMPIYEDEK